MFTDENTSGFSDEELEEMNIELSAKINAGNFRTDSNEAKHIAEEILGRY